MNRQPNPVRFGQVGIVAGIGQALVKFLVNAQGEAVAVSFCQCGISDTYLATHAATGFIDCGDRAFEPARSGPCSTPGRSSVSWCNGRALAVDRSTCYLQEAGQGVGG